MSRRTTRELAGYDEHVVTHPLTDEDLRIRDTVNGLVDSSRLAVLRALDSQPKPPSEIASSGPMSRQTASKHLAEFVDHGLAKRGPGAHGYEITAGGTFILQSVQTPFDIIDQEQLAFLTRSPCAMQVLRTLRDGPVRPGDLTATENSSPSRATIQRALETFTTYGWSTEEYGRYQLTATGKQVLEGQRTLFDRVAQAVEKAAFLQRLSPARPDFPADALADADVIVSDPSSPGKVLGTALKLCDTDIHHFRALTSIYNPTLFNAYYKLFNLGLDGEAIVDASVYQQICDNERTQHLLNDSEYENYRLLRLDESLTLGIGIYDNRKIAIGAYNETGDGRHTAVLLSSNDALVEWGVDLYTSIREQAWHPTDHPTPLTASDSGIL